MDAHSQPPGDRAADSAARTTLDVAALTRRMVAGDEIAYRTFHEAYFDRLSRYLLVVAAGNEEAMREALQATLLRVVRYIKPFATGDAFWSWLTVLARSAFTDEFRKRRRYFSLLDRFTRHAKIEHGRNDNHTDDRLRVLLERHTAALPPDEQKLVEQKYFARRSVREIADELQTSEKAVESKLSRIRRKLKDAVLADLSDGPAR